MRKNYHYFLCCFFLFTTTAISTALFAQSSVDHSNPVAPIDSVYIDGLISDAQFYSSKNYNEVLKLTQKAIELAETIDYQAGKAAAQLIICKTYESGIKYDSTLVHCREAIVYYQKNNQLEKLAWGYEYIGIIYDLLGKREESVESFNAGLALFEQLNHKIGMAYCLNDLAVIHNFKGEFIEASELFFEALKYFENENDLEGQARVHTCLGYFYRRQLLIEKARKAFEKAETIAKSIGNLNWEALAKSGLVRLYKAEKKLEEALNTNKSVLNISETLQSNYIHIEAVKNQALLQFSLGNIEEAEHFTDEALDLYQAQQRTQGIWPLYNTLAKIYIEQGHFQKAEKILKEHPPYEKNQSSLASHHKTWVAYYEKQADHLSAFKHYKIYDRLKKQLDEKRQIRAIGNIEKGYEMGKKQNEINLLNQENEHQRASLQERNFLLLMVVLLLIIMAILFVSIYKIKLRANATLERTVKSRTKNLIKVNKQLEQTNEELQRFAYIASHDLKEPLRNVVGFLQLIERNIKNNNFEDVEEFITISKTNAFQMHELIEDVLEYSRLNEAEISIEEVDLSKVLEQVKSSIQQKAKDQNIYIETTQLPRVKAQHSDMLRLFQNLIENGIKYNNSSKPLVVIGMEEHETTFCISFKDNGIGIQPEHHSNIFNMFTRLHHRGKYSGTGIGLASCKKIVEKYKGSIDVQSQVGNGATFIISLPKEMCLQEELVPYF